MRSRRQVLDHLEPNGGTNAGLWLDKCLPDVEEKGPGRQNHFDELAKIEVSAEYRRFYRAMERLRGGARAVHRSGRGTVQGRMAVGLGAESVLEASIALHRTSGRRTSPAPR